MRRRLALAAITAIVVAFATASVLVVSAGSTPPQANSDGSIPITLTEWEIEVPSGPIPAGRVVLDERNAGKVDHDLLLVRTDRAPDDLPRGLSGPVPGAAGEVVFGEIHTHDHDAGETEDHLSPGSSRRRTVDLDPGSYVLICPLQGHYEAGQAASFEVR